MIRTAVRKDSTVPHTALVYADRRTRNRLLMKATVEGLRFSSVFILGADPASEVRFFGSRAWRNASRGGRTQVASVDARRLCGMRDPANDIRSTFIEAIRHHPGTPPPLIVADWLHLVYDRFDVGLEVETWHVRERTPNLICCYRGEGFWSLDVKQIARVLELHDRTLFGQNEFRWSR